MNRTLKRPMFRIGGSAGTGITSGLDQPRKQYAEGTPNPYAMGNFAPGTGAGFLTQFGLDLLSRPPQGNILQTAAVSAKEPFKDYQAAQFRMGEKMGERNFLTGEREAGEEFKAGEGKLNRATQLEIAGMRNNKSDALYNTMLEKYITDGMQSQAAERAATFETEMSDTLRGAVGGQKFGGVLEIDIRDPEQEKFIKKQKNRFNNKVFYDPYEDNYKYLVIQNGVVSFDEFTTIPEIKFPEIAASGPEIKEPPADVFSPNIEDISGA
ncbi:hypothetical protein N9308_03175 [Candidatus Pelagibacter sp.]|nr:hypothetical protein [Candidatus Pelagibacter sp.]